MNTYQSKTKAKTITAVITVAVIVGIVVIIEILQNNAKTASSTTPVSSTNTTSGTTTTTTPTSTSTSGSTTTTTSSSSDYKDGTYTANASYYVPHGDESIQVTLTVAGGVVTNSSIVNSESDHDSARYQEDFASAYKSYVVGKNLADIKLSYVAGASDTSEGFNDAVAQIQTQAKAS